MKFLILILVLFYGDVEGNSMPKDIKTCSRKDPNLNKCFMENANLAVAYIAKGYPEYDIDTLLPLKWELDNPIFIETPITSTPLKLSLTDINVHGLENITIVKPNIDLEAKQIQFTILNPLIVWKQHYKLSVEMTENSVEKIENFAREIEGNGQIDFVNGEYLVTWNYDFYLDKGVKHAKITNQNFEFVNIDINFDFENIESNKVINNYWNEAKKYFLNDMVMERCGKTSASYMDNIFKHVPFDLVFTP